MGWNRVGKEKMLVTSIFSFYLYVFKSLRCSGCRNSECVKSTFLMSILLPEQFNVFTALMNRSLEIIKGKEEKAGNQYFLLFPQRKKLTRTTDSGHSMIAHSEHEVLR